MDSAETDDGIMYSDVPTQGVKTIYSRIGVLLGWICVVGFLGFLPLIVILRIKEKKEKV